MKTNLMHFKKHAGILILLLLTTSVLVSACGAPNLIPVTGNSTPEGTTVTNTQSGARTTNAPGGNTAPGTLDCQAIGKAFMDFEGMYPTLGIVSNGTFAEANTPGSPMYIDFAKLRADFDVLAALPDSSALGKTSDSIAQFRQLADVVEANFKSGGTPTVDSNGNTQKAIDLYAKLAQPYIVVADAFASTCPNFNAVAATPTP